jgi:uncharacterized protein (DUF1499 family)
MPMTRTRSHKRSSVLARLAWLALIVALGAAVFIGITGPGYRLGLWDYRTGFAMIAPGAYAGLGAAAFALLFALVALVRGPKRAFVVSVLALVIGAAAAGIPWSFQNAARSSPRANDITTDTDNPPQLSALLPLRTERGVNPPGYPGGDMAKVQHQAYPDIHPVHLAMAPAQAFAKALGVIKGMGLTVVYADATGGTIEAYQRTFWYGFTDDVVVRVKGDEGGSTVDIRSKARLGRGDFGVNAKRVRTFLAKLQA